MLGEERVKRITYNDSCCIESDRAVVRTPIIFSRNTRGVFPIFLETNLKRALIHFLLSLILESNTLGRRKTNLPDVV